MKTSIVAALLFTFLFSFSGCDISTDEPGGTDPDYAQKYLGTWHVTDTKARLNYDVTIERSAQSNTDIVLNNFGDLSRPVYGIATKNGVVITNQDVKDYTIEGSGTYVNSKKLEFTYSFSDGIDKEMRDAVFVK